MWQPPHLWDKGFVGGICFRVLCQHWLCLWAFDISQTSEGSSCLSCRFADESSNPTSVLLQTSIILLVLWMVFSLPNRGSGCQDSTEKLQEDPWVMLQRGGGW